MTKSKLAVLLSVALIAIISVFVITEVRADVPNSCDMYYWQGTSKNYTSGYKISIDPDASGLWPIPKSNCNFDNDGDLNGGYACYEFRYKITQRGVDVTSGIGQIDQLIPIGVFTCLGSNTSPGCEQISTIQGIAVPGEGVSDVGPYGYLVDHEYAIRYTTNSSLFSSVLSFDSVGKTSFGIKIGKTNYGCGPIKGVAVPPTGFAQAAVTLFSEHVTEDGHTFCTSTNPATQCEFVVDCDPPHTPVLATPVQEFNFGTSIGSDATQIVSVASPGQACPKFFIKTRGPGTDYLCVGKPPTCWPIPGT